MNNPKASTAIPGKSLTYAASGSLANIHLVRRNSPACVQRGYRGLWQGPAPVGATASSPLRQQWDRVPTATPSRDRGGTPHAPPERASLRAKECRPYRGSRVLTRSGPMADAMGHMLSPLSGLGGAVRVGIDGFAFFILHSSLTIIHCLDPARGTRLIS